MLLSKENWDLLFDILNEYQFDYIVQLTQLENTYRQDNLFDDHDVELAEEQLSMQRKYCDRIRKLIIELKKIYHND